MVRLGSMSLELTEFLLGPLKDLEVLAFDKLQSNIGNKKREAAEYSEQCISGKRKADPISRRIFISIGSGSSSTL